MQKPTRAWRLCIVIFIFLTIISFTPIIIPQGQFKPELFGIPYSLWTSFLITVFLVLLTLIGMLLHPGDENGGEDKP